MDCRIAFSPDLRVDARELAAAWNDTPECRDLAVADLSTEPPAGFPIDPVLMQQGMIVLTAVAGFAGGVLSDALKDVVKEKILGLLKKKDDSQPEPKAEWIRQPGGGYLLLLKGEKE